MATSVEIIVAIKELTITALGLVLPFAAKYATAVAGMSCTLDVLIAKKYT